MKKPMLLGVLTIVLFFFDRATKNVIADLFHEGEGFAVWSGIFSITRVNNTGAAFGLFKNNPASLALVSLAGLVFLLALLWRYRMRNGKASLAEWAWVLIFAGTLGNGYDRLRYGFVIDFLDFKVWPVFNLADSFISIGAFLFLFGLFQRRKIQEET